MALLEISNLQLAMGTFEGEKTVLRDVNLVVEKGSITGVVGETGSGKSLTGLSISRLVPTPPGRYVGGTIRFDGRDILSASEAEMQRLRGRDIGMIFQDPTTNLNPAFRIGTQMVDMALAAARDDAGLLGLPSHAGRRERAAAARRLAVSLLGRVGIVEPEQRIDAYPHQFSGGMRQRVLIAMALIGQPRLLIADEPTTALDVSVQAQVLKLIHSLVQERQLTVIFITHNLGVVAQLCDNVAVMRTGEIVEYGAVRQVLKSPAHAYTKALLASVPTRAMKRGELRFMLEGEAGPA
jgi:ABC-type dipeptide/oligopeptide/nickel transport system ATPase component